MKRKLLFTSVAAFALAGSALTVRAQSSASPLKEVTTDLQTRLDDATAELSKMRADIEKEKLPMTQRLGQVEEQVIEARKEYDRVLRLLDSRTLEVTNLKSGNKSKEDTASYLTNLLDEFSRNFETRMHITELQQLGTGLKTLQNKSNNANLSTGEQLQARFDIVNMALDRLENVSGGAIFDGKATDRSGTVTDGKFIVMGPLAYFASADGSKYGLADLKNDSLDPTLLPLPEKTLPKGIVEVAKTGQGILPIDATRGNAFKLEEQKDSIVEEVARSCGPSASSAHWPCSSVFSNGSTSASSGVHQAAGCVSCWSCWTSANTQRQKS
jgi:biopolymer transport protein ExbB